MPLTPNSGRLLDLGSGQGEDAIFYGRRGWSCVTLDQHISLSFSPRVVGDGKNLPFIDGIFDAVVLRHSLEHMEDPGRVLLEVARVLAPEGEVLLSTPMWNSWQSRLMGPLWYHLSLGQHWAIETCQSLDKLLDRAKLRRIRRSTMSWEHDLPGWIFSLVQFFHKKFFIPNILAWVPATVLGLSMGVVATALSWCFGYGASQSVLARRVSRP